jgi:putative two-component system response regulator
MTHSPQTAIGRVLVVDDNLQVQRVLARILSSDGYDVSAVTTVAEARQALGAGDIELLLSDVNMPGESGLDLIRFALAEHPDTATLLMSGSDDPGIAEVGLEYGAYGYLTKPFSRNQVAIGVANAFRRRTLEMRARATREDLERTVQARTAELDLARSETIDRLARAADYRDTVGGTGAHLQRMSGYCAVLGSRLGVDGPSFKLASALHDVGKIGIPDSVLLKPGPLTTQERREIERHPEIGYQLLKDSGSEVLRLAATIALTHHEKFNGTGYPNGLAGDDIPLVGRIASVADVFDALTSDRVYRPAWSVADTVEEMKRERGRHFDPVVLDAFLDSLDEILAVRSQLSQP